MMMVLVVVILRFAKRMSLYDDDLDGFWNTTGMICIYVSIEKDSMCFCDVRGLSGA